MSQNGKNSLKIYLQVGRVLSLVCISLTLYGGGCVFIVLISQLLGSLVSSVIQLSLCQWMVVVAVILIPLTWAGTPKDFWPIAVGALITTIVACSLIIYTCVTDGIETKAALALEGQEYPVFPSPTYDGIFKGELLFRKTINILALSFWIHHVRLCRSLDLPDHSGAAPLLPMHLPSFQCTFPPSSAPSCPLFS